MGQHKSKLPLSYEEACSRIKPEELNRITEAFDRWASNTGYLPQVTFQKDVLTDSIPMKLSDAMFAAFQGSSKGIALRDVVCGIVLLTRGTREEKLKFIYDVIAGDHHHVSRKSVEEFVESCGDTVDANCTTVIEELFPSDKDVKVSEKEFTDWLSSADHAKFTSFTYWLLGDEKNCLNLSDEASSKTYHQTIAELAGIHLQDVLDLERKYWSLKTTPKFELEMWSDLVSPPVPKDLCELVFNVFDENGDGHIDFPELVQGVATCCRRSIDERRKLCFRVFDQDRDGELTWEEFVDFIRYQLLIEGQNREADPEEDRPEPDPEALLLKAEALALNAASDLGLEKGSRVTLDQFLVWSKSNSPLSSMLLEALHEVCHVRFGLRPTTPQDEARFIGAYMNRASKKQMKEGDVVYLISIPWWESWKSAVNYKDCFKVLPKALPQGSMSPSGRTGVRPHRPSKMRRSKHPGTRGSELRDVSSPSTTPDPGSNSNSAIEMGTEATTDLEATTLVMSSPTEAQGVCKEDARNDLTQIDNSSLCANMYSFDKKLISLTSEGGRLRENLARGVDYELISEEVWRSLSFWYRGRYAQEEPPLPRYVTRAEDGNGLELELYPVHFTMYKHTNYPPQSPKSMIHQVWSVMCTAIGIGGDGGKSNADRLPEGVAQPAPPSRVAYYRAAFSRNATMKEISGILEGLLRVKPDELRLHDFRNEDDPRFLDFEQEGKTVSEMNFRNGDKLLIETCNRDNTWPEELIKALKEAKLKEDDDEDSDKGKAKREERELEVRVPQGVTGLSNLGNTCFMNSAVQCVSNTSCLTHYFKSKRYTEHINKDNPLGMKGDIAKRYGDLVSELWKGTSKSIVPFRFRLTIGRYAPQFAAFQQQDAQELLAFLLDGLHEDLNRVDKKVYRELKDSDGRPDEEVADEAWNYHLERNQSLIVDLFHGQLKSRLRCLKCGFVSVKFDPFTFLSLPLPMESTVEVEVTFVPMDGTGAIRYLFKVDPESKYIKLRDELSAVSGVPTNQIVFMDALGGIIRAIQPLSSKVKAVLGGFLYAFQIPPPCDLKPIARAESLENIARRDRLNTLTKMQKLKKTTSEDQHSQSGRSQHSTTDQPSEEVIQPVPRSESLEHIVRRERLNTLSKREHNTSDQPSEEVIQPIARSESLEHIVRRERLNTLSKERNKVEGREHVVDQQRDVNPPKPTENPPESQQPTENPPESQQPTENPPESQQPTENPPESQQPIPSPPISPSSIKEPATQPGDLSSATPTHQQMSNNMFDNYVIAMHRKLVTMDGPYFLAINKTRFTIFGTPVVVACGGKTNKELYQEVWRQVERLISKDTKFNQRLPEGPYFPFELKMVDKFGMRCERCPWYKFCHGCKLECNDDVFSNPCSYLAIDWDSTVLHLRYQYPLERPREHESLLKNRTEQSEPIDLFQCLKAFTKEEELGEDDPWYCKQCKEHQPAAKKLEIWRVPPVLIVHVKRFQFHHSRWIKSQRVVNFPTLDFDPLCYKTADGEDVMKNGGCEGNTANPKKKEDFSPQEGLPVSSPTTNEVEVEVHNPTGAEGGTEKNSSGEKPNSEIPTPENPLAEISANKKSPEEPPPGDEIPSHGKSPDGDEQTERNDDISTQAGANGRVTLDVPSEDPPLSLLAHSYAKQVSTIDTTEKRPTYNLYAVTTHYGALGGGHYVAFAKNPNGKWYHYNDSACRETTEERVTKEPPYLLFYERNDFDFNNIIKSLSGPDTFQEGTTEGGEGGNSNSRRCKVM